MAEKENKAPKLQDELPQKDSRKTPAGAEKHAAPKNASKKAAKPGFFARISKWFRELKSETKKVVWPSMNQVVKNTVIVLITIAIIGVFIWVFDFLISQGNLALTGLFS